MSVQQLLIKRLNFDSTVFDATMEHCFGEEILAKAKNLKQSPTYQERLAKNFFVVDKTADELATSIRQGSNRSEDFALALKEGIDCLDNPSIELERFIRSAENIPTFIDRDMVELGGRVFRTKLDIPGLMLYGFPVSIYNQAFIPSITMALMFSMQPKAEPETILQALAKKSSKQRGAVRLLETFKWFGKVSGEGAGQLYSEPYIESCRIRLVHAHIRAAISANMDNWNFSPGLSWRTQELGLPLSASDGSIVVSSVVAAIYAMRRHLKKRISHKELEALNHWSNYVSYLQGVPEDLLYPRAEETIAHFAAFMMSTNVDTYHDELAAFVESFQNLHMEKALFRKSKPLQLLMNGLTQAIIDETFSEDIQSLYHINKAPLWAKGVFRTAKYSMVSINTISGKSELVNRFLEKQSGLLWSDFIPEAEKTFSQYYGKVIG